ncbi:unnamed protein product [Tetraodon nigroviridis]|uniref:(spotted green pufferfish) hypothetical protein n=1 Tax=Tetraodon nigroviridis TaxID=99883 RepID=Q4S2G4_TETNG|nr:unnamed protein product [Tetraodon nigroviridis]
MSCDLFKWLVLAFCISQQGLFAVARPDVEDESDDSASTLAFVFDVTGSMYDDLKQVIDGASRILEKTLSRRTRPIKNFVLVPFHDPGLQRRQLTKRRDSAVRVLQMLTGEVGGEDRGSEKPQLGGGGDCPEMSVGAIKKALEVSLPGSFIYVFTDARAKDYRLKRDVLQLVQLRQSQVVFVLTGDCGDRSQPGYRAYEEIAATSSGQIFHLDKQQVNEVLKWVEETVQAMKVHLLSSNHDGAQENKWDVPFDPSLREHRLWRLPEFRTPSQSFFIRVTDPPLVSMPDVVKGFYMQPVVIRCSVGSPIPYKLRFTRDGITVGEEKLYQPPQGGSKFFPTRPFRSLGCALRTLENITVWPPMPTEIAESPCGFMFQSQVFSRGDEIRFVCSASGSPTPQLFWSHGNTFLTNRLRYITDQYCLCMFPGEFEVGSTLFAGQDDYHGTLHIRGVQKVDAGQYTCVASSPAGTATGTVSLKVGGESAFQCFNTEPTLPSDCTQRRFSPLTEDPLFSETPADLMAKIGENVTLRCSARGSPQPTVSWHRHDGRQILTGSRSRMVQLEDGHLLIQGVWLSDEGLYVCEAKNPFGTIKTGARLSVTGLVPPEIHAGPYHYIANEGVSITLFCKSSGVPKPDVVWGGSLSLGTMLPVSVHQMATFHIPHPTTDDAGIYVCTSTNPVGYASREIQLSVNTKPRIQPAATLLKALIGQSVTLPCVVQGEPSPEVTWFHNGLPVGIKNTTPLRIQKAKLNDQGTYKCVATNSAGQETSEIKLDILDAPSFAEPGDALLEKVANTKVIIPCPAEGSPRPKIRWYRNGLEIHPEQSSPELFVSEDGALTISSASASHSGDFMCVATNEAGSVERKTRLKIEGDPPVFGIQEEKVRMNGSLTLACMTKGFPEPKIQWFKDGQVGGTQA